jgi:hypothetical protein
MPIRKEKIETITIWDQEEITPNKSVPLGETRTPKAATITINHDKGRKKISKLTSLAPYVVNMGIILTTAPKLSITNR